MFRIHCVCVDFVFSLSYHDMAGACSLFVFGQRKRKTAAFCNCYTTYSESLREESRRLFLRFYDGDAKLLQLRGRDFAGRLRHQV